jgi:pantothenate kinase
MTLDRLALDAIALADSRRRAVLGVAGSPGAGKSTLTELLLDRIRAQRGDGWAAHVPMDGFHLADVQLRRLGLLDRKGAPETFDADGYAHLLARLRRETDVPVYAPGFERDVEQPLAAALSVPAEARLIITEGNYLLLDDVRWTAVRAQIDSVWFVECEADVRIERLVARHVEFGKSPAAARDWVGGTDQRNADLVAATSQTADRVVTNGVDGWQAGEIA